MHGTDAEDRPITGRTIVSPYQRVLTTLLSPLLVLVSAITLAAAVPLRFQQLKIVTPNATLVTGQLDPAGAAALAELGWTARDYAVFITGLEATAAILLLLIGAVIFWLRKRDPAVFFFALTLVLFGLIGSPLLTALQDSHGIWSAIVELLRPFALASLMIAFLRFPDGRFVPAWSRWLVFVWLGYLLIALFVPSLRFTSSLIVVSSRQAASLVWALGWLGVIVVLQVYRYRYRATAEQRQQTKWVVYGMFVAFGLSTFLSIPLIALPSLREPSALSLALRIVGVAGILLGEIFFGLSVAIAILRYRLYDIDLIINRTLVYTVLTGGMVLIYLITIVVLQSLLPVRSEVATVLSTLAVATAFTPLRRRIQTIIDRHFYRRKYNAALTLSRFAHIARDEVDMQILTSALAGAVAETMQPTHVSLWLAPTDYAGAGERRLPSLRSADIDRLVSGKEPQDDSQNKHHIPSFHAVDDNRHPVAAKAPGRPGNA